MTPGFVLKSLGLVLAAMVVGTGVGAGLAVTIGDGPTGAASKSNLDQAVVRQVPPPPAAMPAVSLSLDQLRRVHAPAELAGAVVPRPSLPATPDRAPDLAPRTPLPMVAVVIDDLGWDAGRTDWISELPGPLTLSFLPHGRDLADQIAVARAAGHEIWAHIPMEPLGDEDPGPGALRVGLSKTETLARFRRALARIGPVAGFNNHMGSRFTAEPRGMIWVLDEAKRHDIAFLDSQTSGRSLAYGLAQQAELGAARRDVFLDHSGALTVAHVAAQLRSLEQIARARGSAIAIGHPNDITLTALARWLATLDASGIELIGARALIDRLKEAPDPRSPRVAAVR